jgi:seryl-tRNA synthetase
MLDAKRITSDLENIARRLGQRPSGAKWRAELEKVVTLDGERKKKITEVEQLKSRRNQASQEIAKAKKEGRDAAPVLEEMKAVADRVKRLDEEVAGIEAQIRELLLGIPNVPADDVPVGSGPEDNVEARRWGTPRKFPFTPRTHDEIGEALGILDFKKAGEVTGSRFCFLKGRAARLERALINFMLETHVAAGYEEIAPPLLVNRQTLVGTGQLPKFEEDVFRIEKFDWFLIPTAEVPVTNYHRDEILSEKDLPKKYVAYTPCFRSEAGSYGKDTKGLKRQHQFDKVELVKFATPATSATELELLTADAEKILQKLELPYRVVTLCTGDMGASAMKTYDIEVWSPAQNGWMEISSCSNFGDYQARRANIRYRSEADGRPAFAHTLNGSGLAVGRTLLAILENYQREDGSFDVPKALADYL